MKLADTFYKKKNKKNVDMNLNRFVHFKFTYNIYSTFHKRILLIKHWSGACMDGLD